MLHSMVNVMNIVSGLYPNASGTIYIFDLGTATPVQGKDELTAHEDHGRSKPQESGKAVGTRHGGVTTTGKISDVEFASRMHQDTETTAGVTKVIEMKGGGSGIGIAS